MRVKRRWGSGMCPARRGLRETSGWLSPFAVWAVSAGFFFCVSFFLVWVSFPSADRNVECPVRWSVVVVVLLVVVMGGEVVVNVVASAAALAPLPTLLEKSSAVD